MSATTPPAPTLLTPRILIGFIIVTVVWGSTWLVIRDQLSVVPASWSVTYRFAVAGIAMFLLLLVRRLPLTLPPRAMGFAALLGLAQFCLNFNFVYRAEGHITSGLVSVIYALLIVPNTLLSRLFLGTPVQRKFLAGGTVAMAGVILLLMHEAQAISADSHSVLLGTALAFCGVACASSANIMQATRFGKAQPIFTVLAWAMVWGTLADALFAYATVGAPVLDMRPGYVAGVLYLAVMGSVLAFPLYFSIIRDVGAGPAAWSGVLVPIIAMALSTLAEGYVWSGLSIGGAVLVMAGLVVALRPERVAAPPA